MGRTLLATLVLALMLATTAAIALFLFPHDSDGAFAAYDGIWFAIGAEEVPEQSISGHHPLFHVLVIALVAPLRALEVAAPGHVACRIVAGLGGVWLILQIALLAGRRRMLAGVLFALVILCTRGFVVEMASGENVVPAAAAALFALTVAARPAPNLVLAGGALVLALLLRQDNVFVVPGAVAVLAAGLPRGDRLHRVLVFLAAAGAATIAGYLAAWSIHGATPLREWILGYGLAGPHTGPRAFEWDSFGLYARSVTLAMTGRIAHPEANGTLIALAYVAAILFPALLLRGTAPNVRLAMAIVLTLAGRAFFHTWFEADNHEWLVLPVAFVAALGSGAARGEPRTGPVARRIGVLLLLALSAWLLVAHGPITWRLHDRELMTAIGEAIPADRPAWRFIAANGNVHTGLHLMGIPHVTISEGGFGPELADQLRQHPVPTVVIGNRLPRDRMPNPFQEDPPMSIDAMDDPPQWKILRRDGRAYAAWWTPDATTSAPATK